MTKKASKIQRQDLTRSGPSKTGRPPVVPDMIKLSAQDQAAFAEALLNPPAPNEALARAMQRGSKLFTKEGRPDPPGKEKSAQPGEVVAQTATEGLSPGASREKRGESCSWPQVAEIESALRQLPRPRIRARAIRALRELAAVMEYEDLRIQQLLSLMVTDERGDPIGQEGYEELLTRANVHRLSLQEIREAIEAFCPSEGVALCDRQTAEGIRLRQRDPRRIPYVMEAIRQVWEKLPDFRLGQLIVGAIGPSRDAFSPEETELLEGLIRMDRILNPEGHGLQAHGGSPSAPSRNESLPRRPGQTAVEGDSAKPDPIAQREAYMEQAVWSRREMWRVAGALEEIARAARHHLEDPSDPAKTERLKDAMKDAFFIQFTGEEK